MQNLKTSTLIRNGLKHLWDGRDGGEVSDNSKEEYLCHAIMRAGRGGSGAWMLYTYRHTQESERRLQDVRDMIAERLFPYNSLSSWLEHCGDVSQSEMTHERLQEHRRKWALKMIAEFKAKGD